MKKKTTASKVEKEIDKILEDITYEELSQDF